MLYCLCAMFSPKKCEQNAMVSAVDYIITVTDMQAVQCMANGMYVY